MNQLLLFITLSLCFSGFSQKYKPDVFGHVSDPTFLQLVKTRNYQLVGAFDTLPDAQKTMAAQVLKNDNWIYLDWNGTEYSDYNTMGLALGFIHEEVMMEVDPGERVKDPMEIQPIPVVTKFGKTGVFSENGKQGYYYHDQVVLKPEYESVTELYQDNLLFLRIQKNGLYGVCDYQGKELATPRYQQLENTMLPTAACAFKVKLNQKQGVISRNGKETIPPIYDQVREEFQAPYSLILVTKNGLSGIFNSSGKEIIPCEYEELNRIWHRTPRLAFQAKRNNTYGILGINGEVTIPFNYTSPIYYQEDTGIILFTKPWRDTFKSGAMDTLGNRILDAEYYEITQPEGGNCLFVREAINQPVAIYSLKGKKITEPLYNSYEKFGYNRFKIMIPTYYILQQGDARTGKYGLFNVRTLTWAFPCDYDLAVKGGEYLKIGKQVGGDYCYGIVDTTGNMLIPVNYTYLQLNDVERNAVVQKNALYGVIDFSGKELIPFTYKKLVSLGNAPVDGHLRPFLKAHYLFNENDKIGLINEQQKIIIPATYRKLIPDRTGVLGLYNDSSLVLSYSGKKLIGPVAAIIIPEVPGVYVWSDENGVITHVDLYGNKTIEGPGLIQEVSKSELNKPELLPEKSDQTIHQIVDENARFTEGDAALKQFIATNLKYPENAKELGIQGKCYIRFVVSETGQCSDFEVVRGVPDCKECDKEAIRILKLMPDWKPGRLNGKNVRSYYNLPVKFSLD
ncbi:MAG: energy transducer TonB [Fluviicola sp.]|nr:energy transducer TonB [Fluviicola sp.]